MACTCAINEAWATKHFHGEVDAETMPDPCEDHKPKRDSHGCPMCNAPFFVRSHGGDLEHFICGCVSSEYHDGGQVEKKCSGWWVPEEGDYAPEDE